MMTAEPDDVEVLDQRARLLARPVEARATVATPELLVVSVGAAALAVAADRVREVLPPGPVARLPRGGPLGLALRNVRGAVLVVVDLGALVGVVPEAAVPERWLVVLDHVEAPVGALVDRVAGLAKAEAVGPLPAGEGPAGLLAGVTAEGVWVIDPDALLARTALLATGGETGPGDDQEGAR